MLPSADSLTDSIVQNQKELSKMGCDIKEEKAAFVKVVEESEATGKVKETYEDIKKTLGIDFIPNIFILTSFLLIYARMSRT